MKFHKWKYKKPKIQKNVSIFLHGHGQYLRQINNNYEANNIDKKQGEQY